MLKCHSVTDTGCGNDSLKMIGSCKVGRVFPVVIWSEFRMGKYRDDDHREYAPYFTKNSNLFLLISLEVVQLLPSHRDHKQQPKQILDGWKFRISEIGVSHQSPISTGVS